DVVPQAHTAHQAGAEVLRRVGAEVGADLEVFGRVLGQLDLAAIDLRLDHLLVAGLLRRGGLRGAPGAGAEGQDGDEAAHGGLGCNQKKKARPIVQARYSAVRVSPTKAVYSV